MQPQSEFEGNYRELFEASPDPYLILAADPPTFTIVAVSDAYLHATMTQRESIVGRGLFDVFPDNPDDPTATGMANLRASLGLVISDRRPDTMAVQRYDIAKPEEDGGGFETRFWSPRNTPLCAPDGSVRLIIHRVEDVTELVGLQRRGSEQEDEIYRRAQEIQEVNRELRAANVRLAELDRAKTAFFSNISHEFRTPLTLILGQLDRLRAGADAEPAQASIARSARLLLRHVNDLLHAAKLESETVSLDYEEVDLASLAAIIVDTFRGEAERRHQMLTLSAPDALICECDRGQVERVLVNLIGNALKFTPEGGAITCTVCRHEDRAELSVRDNGPGIEADWGEKVFERFRQVESELVRSHEGTGLGLAIARDIVELHGGVIELVEHDQPGAWLRVQLPLTAPATAPVRRSTITDALVRDPSFLDYWQQPDTDIARPEEGSGPEEAAGPEVGSDRRTVLIVEDNVELAAYLRDVLAADFTVFVAPNGGEGFDLALRKLPDLILTDLMMPWASGVDLVGAVRSRPELDGVPIVVLTAKLDDELRERLLGEGVSEYLVKPVSAKELRARASNLIAARQTARDLARADERFRSLLESLPDASVIVDDRGQITFVNHEAEALFGYPRDEMIGNPVDMLIPEAVRARHVDQRDRFLAELLTRPMGISVEIFGRRGDGTEFPVEIRLHAIQAEGEVLIASSIRDLTKADDVAPPGVSERRAAVQN